MLFQHLFQVSFKIRLSHIFRPGVLKAPGLKKVFGSLNVTAALTKIGERSGSRPERSVFNRNYSVCRNRKDSDLCRLSADSGDVSASADAIKIDFCNRWENSRFWL